VLRGQSTAVQDMQDKKDGKETRSKAVQNSVAPDPKPDPIPTHPKPIPPPPKVQTTQADDLGYKTIAEKTKKKTVKPKSQSNSDQMPQ
jgi:hypothetical protein